MSADGRIFHRIGRRRALARFFIGRDRALHAVGSSGLTKANAVRLIPIGADVDDLYYFTTTARI
jgi:hypothetical protein